MKSLVWWMALGISGCSSIASTGPDASLGEVAPAILPDAPTAMDGAVADGAVAGGDTVVDCGTPTVACTPVSDGCGLAEICGNGLDDDCNGAVDDGCPCVVGAVQRCFAGTPGHRGVGACTDGAQVCVTQSGTDAWGACTGGIGPSAESCNGIDDDCNGCVDDGLCCTPAGPTCPSANDPRIPVGVPFATYFLRGSDLLAGTFRRWHWHVEGGPCDQLLWDTSHHVSYAVSANRHTTEDATGDLLHFTPSVSGDYAVTLTADALDGTTITCNFVIHVRAPGLRVELCWDRTGSTNLDLWLHDPRNQNPWGQLADDATCAWYDCRNVRAGAAGVPLDWGYAPTSGGVCKEPDANGACNNPRLDEDNRSTQGEAENVDVDAPRDGDVFRIAVNYYAGTGAVHPMVNVYCGGELRATFGGATVGTVTHGPAPVDGITVSGQDDTGSVWRVADVRFHEPADGCDVTPLGTAAGQPCVDSTGDRSFAAGCVAATSR